MKKKISAIILSLILVFSVLVPAGAVTVPGSETNLEGKLIILHTNDTHGRDYEGVYSTASVSQLKKDYEAAGAEVLLISAGDATQGTPLVNLEEGKLAIEFMNAANYDVMVPGNHEFDWGTENLLDILQNVNFTVLSSNILNSSTNEPLFDANCIAETESGLKIGIFGITTPETATKAHPDKVKGTKFLAGEEMFAAAQEQVDALTAANCDLIVAVGHLGDSDESAGNRSIDLIENVDGIDLFIDGHSHTTLKNGEKQGDTLRVSTGEYLNNIGVVEYDGEALTAGLLGGVEEEITKEDGTKETVIVPEYKGVDEELWATLEAANAAVEESLSETFGSTEVLLNGERAPGVRTEETNLGNFAADANLWAAKKALGEDKVDVAIVNGGNIRASIQPGEISMKTMNTVFPFGNVITTVTVTGAELLEALEAATWSTPDAIGAFPQIAGMSYTLNTAIRYEKGEMYPNSTYYAPANPGSRITNLKIGGEPVDLKKEYVVATNDFIAAGGDTYGVFVGKPIYNTGVLLDEALVDYTKTELNGVITEAKYGALDGRINIVNKAETPEDYNITPDAWYYDAVAHALKNYYMGSISKTEKNFAPQLPLSRATIFQVFYNIEGQPEVADGFETTFTDIEGKWYADAAIWAESVEIAMGLGEGIFAGDKIASRAEMATILTRYLEYKEIDTTSDGTSLEKMADAVEVPDWAKFEMSFCLDANLMVGKLNKRLDPLGNSTRAELAAVLRNRDFPVDVEAQVEARRAA